MQGSNPSNIRCKWEVLISAAHLILLIFYITGGVIVIVSRADYVDTVPDYKANLIPMMDKFVQDGIWKLLVAEVNGYYHFGHEAMVWKFQVLKSCIKE